MAKAHKRRAHLVADRFAKATSSKCLLWHGFPPLYLYPSLSLFLFTYFHQTNSIHAATGDCDIAILRDIHVAHDAATGRNFPGLEFFGLGIEAHKRIRTDPGFAVPEDVVEGDDPVGL